MGKKARSIGAVGGAALLLSGISASASIIPAHAADTSAGTTALAALLASRTDPFDGAFPIISGSLKGESLVSQGNFTVDSFYGPQVGQPGQLNTFQGHETFAVNDADGNQIGTVDALVSHSVGAGNPNMEVLVTGIHPESGVDASQFPTLGSVLNWAWSASDPGTFTNYYANIAGPDALTWHAFGTNPDVYAGGESTNGSIVGMLFNPDYSSNLLAQNALVRDDDFQLPNGNHLIAVPDTETITAVTNTSPYAIATQGISEFAVVKPDGTVVGTFWGNTISTADLVGGHSFEIVPNSDYGAAMMGDPDGVQTAVTDADFGTGAGQLPPDGSVFNMLYLFSPDAYNVYTDYNMASFGQPNEIAQLWNWFGLAAWATPTFDAVKNMTDGGNLFDNIHYISDDAIGEITPTDASGDATSMTITGVNGMPNGGVNGLTSDIQGTQEFSFGGQQFWAYVMDYANGNGTIAESLYLDQALNDSNGISSLPTGLTYGSEIDFTHGTWWDTLQVQDDPLSGGDVSQYLSIPLFGGAWTELDPGSEWWLGMLGITF